MNLDEAKLALQAALGEDSTRRFLPGGEDAMTLSCEIAALANTQGGTIFWGICEDGQVTGLERVSLPRANRVLQAAAESLVPPVVVHTQNIPLAGNRLVVVVEVPEARKPCLDREGRHWVKSAAGRLLVRQNDRERSHDRERTQNAATHARQRSLSLASLLSDVSGEGCDGPKGRFGATHHSPDAQGARLSRTGEDGQGTVPSKHDVSSLVEGSPAEDASHGCLHAGDDRWDDRCEDRSDDRCDESGPVLEEHGHGIEDAGIRSVESGNETGSTPSTAAVESRERHAQDLENAADFSKSASPADMGDGQKFFEKNLRFDANTPDGREAKEVYRLMKNDINVTVDTMSVHLGRSRRTVLKRVATLKELGVLVRHGTSRGGHWELVPEVALDLGLEDVLPVDGEAEKG